MGSGTKREKYNSCPHVTDVHVELYFRAAFARQFQQDCFTDGSFFLPRCLDLPGQGDMAKSCGGSSGPVTWDLPEAAGCHVDTLSVPTASLCLGCSGSLSLNTAHCPGALNYLGCALSFGGVGRTSHGLPHLEGAHSLGDVLRLHSVAPGFDTGLWRVGCWDRREGARHA